MLKRAREWVLASPQNVFLTVFTGIMVGLVIRTAQPIPLDQWMGFGRTASQTAAIFALAAVIKGRCGWLSLKGAFGLIVQAICALLVLALPLAIRTGYGHLSATVTSLDETELVALSMLALGSVIGLLRNDWWGYHGEALLIAVVIAMTAWPGSAIAHTAHLPSDTWCITVLSLAWIHAAVRDLLRAGKRRRIEQRFGCQVAV